MLHGLRGWRRTRPLGRWVGLGLVLLLAASGRAQGPGVGGDPGAAKTYTNKMSFYLPIKLDDRSRGNLREVQLYVKANAGEWRQQDSASPAQDHFKYKVTQDGEYWFAVVLVDQMGRKTPADVSREPPALMVVVDTLPPTIDVQPTPLPGGRVGVRCVVQDANPDPRATVVSCLMPDQNWRPMQPVDNNPGVYALPGTEAPNGMVRVVAADRAGNKAQREINLRELTGAAPRDSGVVPAGGQTPTGVDKGVQRVGYQPPTQTEPTPVTPPPANTGNTVPPNSVPANPEPAPSPVRPAGGLLLNTTQASINYRIDHVGPSGVGKVEVWVTADKGQNWKCMGEDHDKRSPAEVALPGDGVYGVKLVVTNGNGFGGKAPVPGEAPASWVEVDTTAPKLELREMDATSAPGHITIRWSAADKNLAAEPIALHYATQPKGPWLPIARNVKNDGTYRWAFPRDSNTQFYVRVDATDLAGNVARAETPAPIVLDVTEPNATVVDISGGVRPGRQ